ncbi:hypothetical protein PV11_07638 [Exophiala sideris]|uniref:CHY-type domain-containing protein n=1 Tax=Exophiala sideris TaxID=1016849 RepID=A0A0D1VV63_9EURO|nr:hypothetical protein PV11_07638 [Exophiala sideris]
MSNPTIGDAMSQPDPSPQQVSTCSTAGPAKAQTRVCRFYNTSKGCRAGSQCPFRHVQPKELSKSTKQPDNGGRPEGSSTPSAATSSNLPQRLKSTARAPVPHQKPVSQLQQADPREFQIGQLMRRYSPTRKDSNDGTLISFILTPSDPDFPFELEGLHCTMTIPTSWPQGDKPSIRVTNTEMPRGYQINVERGFDTLIAQSPHKTLLALMNELDRNLERFLTSEKAQTIKIVANTEKREESSEPIPEIVPFVAPMTAPAPPPPSWTAQQKADAQTKRQSDIRQLEARMGRLPNFSKNTDATLFNIPVQIPKPGRLPADLQPLKEVALRVPKLYNLEPCTVQLKGIGGSEAENVQFSFEKHAREHSDLTLMAHINHLIQNIHAMALEGPEKAATPPPPVEAPQSNFEQAIIAGVDEDGKEEGRILDEERPHVRVISRPPEWDQRDDSDGSSDTSFDSDEYTDSESEDEENETNDGGGAALPATSAPADKGIHLSFPELELYNIELLTLISLSISVKCLRCKTPLDIHNIKASNQGQSTVSTRTESCPKCTTPFTVSFAPEHLHANSVRAGTVDITGCTITDLLPSVFQPTCSSCSATFPVPPGMISVRSDKPIQVCRSCHAKMSFTIPGVKFLRVSHHAAALPLRRPKKENLGISAGTPLPNKGTCQHYRHSYRWFRFGCCGRVYPCDRCHDAAESHVNEHADRMVCGWCSREQRFRSEDCALCGRSVIRRRRAAGGFWEGGQGTREKRLMSRKDKHKYKRTPGSVPGKKADGK